MAEVEELVASRIKLFGLWAICLGFLAVAVFLPKDGGDQSWRWVCLALFGLGAVLLAIVLVRPQRVLLDRDGFTIAGGLARSPRQVLWRDVDRFFVYRLPRGNKMIGYALTKSARPDTYLGDVARGLGAGADGLLPKTLPGSPEAIAAYFEDYRARVLRLTFKPAPLSPPRPAGR